ncbi:MAG: hypothetical protein KOO63_08290 [Bacteroidales bacterium]|nr:hypothetical protein [Candidatus Latescibacterota bacterium]
MNRLTAEQIGDACERIEAWIPSATAFHPDSGIHKVGLACQQLLSHAAALEAENAELRDTIYDLQMADPHLEFISRVQDVGMHHDWDDFMDALTTLEREQ